MLLGLSSCSNDDNGNTATKDILIGVWYYFSDEGVELDECEKKSTITFTEDGKYSSIQLAKDFNGNCVDDFKSSGVWENIEGNKYKFKLDDEDEFNTFDVIFSNNNNTMEVDDLVFKRK